MLLRSPIRTRLLTHLVVIGVVYLSTFCVILPRMCRDLVYSTYFVESFRDQLRAATEQHQRRVDTDSEYIDNLPSDVLSHYAKRLAYDGNDVIVTVVTSERTVADVGTGYLTQVMAAFDRMLRSADDFRRVAIFMCNTDGRSDGHEEALWLADYFPMVTRVPDHDVRTISIQNPEKQRADYVYCLNAAHRYRSNYVMMVEDDAVPNPDLFNVMNRVLDRKITRKWRRGELVNVTDRWAYVKLYYPDRWRSYGSNAETSLEVVAFGVLGGAATSWLFMFCRRLIGPFKSRPNAQVIFIVAAIYFGLICILIGRPYVQKWRRVLPDFYGVVSAPECCIPAVLYPKSVINELVAHLNNVTCRNDPVDIVIDRYFAGKSYSRYLIEPSLFKHRGMYSSIKGQSVHPAMFLD